MKTQSFLVDFVKDYGLKEGIIISELCRRTCLSGSAPCCFSVADCMRIFGYMTEKQIRTALNKLLARRCVGQADVKKSFDRTVRFRVSDAVKLAYLDAVISGELYERIS
jgi:hypothetical protein